MSESAAVQHRLVSLADVGLLARVRRPVVSQWRARYAGREHPYPGPAVTHSGQDFFDCGEVVDFLEANHLGNNPDARQDAIAFSAGASDVISDPRLFAAMTALLCLRVTEGAPLPASSDDLLDLAEAFDSDDELLFREIEAATDQLEALGRYTNLLVAAAFDPTDPLDDLVDRHAATLREQTLHPNARSLIASAALALADDAGFIDPLLVVQSVADVDLITAAAKSVEATQSLAAAVIVPSGSTDEGEFRLARRRLHAHGLRQIDIVDAGQGDYLLPDEAVVIARFRSTAHQQRDLAALSDLSLNLSDRQRALVFGPAATLTEPMLARRRPGRPAVGSDELSGAGVSRSDALRTGAVRAIVRLPRGLMSDQPRARAALWCLRSDRSSPSSALCIDAERPLSAARSDQLVTDLVTASRGETERRHPVAGARRRLSSDLAQTHGALVEPVAPRANVGGEWILTDLRDRLDQVAAPLPGLDRPRLAPAAQLGMRQHRTVSEAVRRGEITMLAGARVNADDLEPNPQVTVLTHPSQLGRREAAPGLSLFSIASHYPRAELTRPGDIVLANSISTGPAAQVDRIGGALVAYPARVLRLRSRGRTDDHDESPTASESGNKVFTPEAVADDINRLPVTAQDWRVWPLTLLPEDQLEATETVLTQIADRCAQLRTALAQTEAVTGALIGALGAGACTFEFDPTDNRLERIHL